MPIILQNDTASTLRVGVAAGDTTLIVASGQGSRFPTLGVGDYFYATLEDTAGDKEIVQITARSGDNLTAVRGAESTAAREFPAGSTIEMRVTAASVIDAAANAVSLSALGVTASAAELNVLDGITASTAELNLLDGVTWTLTDYNTLTATAVELNLLDGVTWTLTDYNTLTTSAAELNVLDGITASTAELNLLDGVTWTLTDYNTLTATAAELNTLDGVTTAGTNIVRAADAAAQRTLLSLGGLATLDILDEDDFASDSATRPPSQQSTKAFLGVANAPGTKAALNAAGSAPIYACRAWVNFNGTGTVAIRGSGNVSSITDNGTGDYTVNFTTAMPDTDYAVVVGNSAGSGVNVYSPYYGKDIATASAPTVNSFRTWLKNSSNGLTDVEYISFVIVR